MENFPLEGLRVIGLTQIIVGPVATRILASLGAEVITVEPPSPPPASHGQPTPPPFSEVNRGKLSISIDLNNPRGKDLFHGLVRASDVLVQNYSPRAIRNLGVTYDELRRINPGLVMVSVSAIEPEGPWSDIIAFGPGCDALSGMSDLTGYADGPPLKPGNFYADQSTAFHVAFAVLAALEQRRRTGKGQHIVAPLRRVLMATIGEIFVEHSITGEPPRRMGNRDSSMAPHNVYPCEGEDNWIAIAVSSDQEWLNLRRAMGDPPWASDVRFDTGEERLSHQDEIDQHIREWTRNKGHLELMRHLQSHLVRAGAVLKSPEILSQEQYQRRNILDFVDVPEAGRFCSPGLAFRLSASPVNLGKASPSYAQDTEQVLREILKLPQGEIEQLIAERVVT